MLLTYFVILAGILIFNYGAHPGKNYHDAEV